MIPIQLLVFNKASIAIADINGRNSLHHAALLGNATILNFLVKNWNKDVSTIIHMKDNNGQTALVHVFFLSIFF